MQIRILFLVCIKVCFCPNESLQKHHKFKIHPAWAMNQDFVKNWSQWWADELHLSHLTQMEKNIGAGTFVWMFNFTLMKPFFQVTCLVFKRLWNCCFLPGFCISYLQGIQRPTTTIGIPKCLSHWVRICDITSNLFGKLFYSRTTVFNF